MKLYIASKSNHPNFALHPSNFIEVCQYEADAIDFARNHTSDTDESAYVYSIDIESRVGFRATRDVVSFVTTY